MQIEQAIFTSTMTERGGGYQLVSHSPGLSAEDAHELNLWGPSHDSLLDRGGARWSINFFRLASGLYCISRTVPAGAEYSGRGEVIYTQFLIVSAEVLARFSNNPFAVVRALTATGEMGVCEPVPKALPTLRLGGRAAGVDVTLVAQLARDPGPAAMAWLVDAALAGDRVAVSSHLNIERVFAGLFSLLPLEIRPEFSFSTGLKISTSRPLRLSALPEDHASWRGMERDGFSVLNLDEADRVHAEPAHAWAECVRQVLASGKFSLLAGELERFRPGLTIDTLNGLCEEVQNRLHPPTTPFTPPAPAPAAAPRAPVDARPAPALLDTAATQRHDGAHVRQKVLAAVKSLSVKSSVEQLMAVLADQPAEVLEMLERIDDLVFTAIDGDPRALEELQVLWPAIADELDENLVEQSREQYLRCALAIWNECVEGQARRPERAVAAIDVLCVLFED